MTPTLVELRQAWRDENDLIQNNDEANEAASCADLPYEVQEAIDPFMMDPEFGDALADWSIFVFQRQIMLAIEQSCYEGMLVSDELRVTRLQSCPPEWVASLAEFLRTCPDGVREWLTFHNFHVVRIERARRTGSAEWRAHAAILQTRGKALRS